MGDLQEFTHCRCCYCTLPYLISGCLLNNTHDVIPLFYDVVMEKHEQNFAGYGIVMRRWIVVWYQIWQHSCRVTTALVGSRRCWLEEGISMDNRKASVQDGVVAMTGLWQAASKQVVREIRARQALLCILWRSVTMAPLRIGCISAILLDKSPNLLSIFNDAICGNMANMAIIIAHNWLLI